MNYFCSICKTDSNKKMPLTWAAKIVTHFEINEYIYFNFRLSTAKTIIRTFGQTKLPSFSLLKSVKVLTITSITRYSIHCKLS